VDVVGTGIVEIRFGPAYELAADSLPAVLRTNHDQADDSSRPVNGGLSIVAPEAGVDESHEPRGVEGENQAVAIEIGLRENDAFESIGREANGSPATELAGMPEFEEPRRIGVLERSVLDHGDGDLPENTTGP
jgi:hypothetical protein